MGAERGLRDRDGDLAVQVFAFPAVEGMRVHVDDEDEIAGLPSALARVAGARNADTAAFVHSRRQLDVHPVALHHPAFARAARAGAGAERARSTALAAAAAEDHASAVRPHLAGAGALGAGHGADGPLPRSPAGFAAIEAHDVEAPPRRVEGLVERDPDGFLEVLAAVRAFARRIALGVEDAGEDVLEGGAAHPDLGGEIEPFEPDLRDRGLRRPRLAAVVGGAPLDVHQHLERLRDGAEAVRGDGIPRLRSGCSWRAAFWNARRISATLALRLTPSS
jgi:hypothetical protein